MEGCNTNPFDSQSTNLVSAKIAECCDETNNNLQTIAGKIDTLTNAQVACCETIGGKLDQVIDKLQTIIDS